MTQRIDDTYEAAKRRLLKELADLDWDVLTQSRRTYQLLKVPHATKGDIRLWFKPQAILVSFAVPGYSHIMSHAHSLGLDMRYTPAADVVAKAERFNEVIF